MAQLEGFRVQNYRSLRDVTIGRLYEPREGDKLTPLTAVIGKNGVGKSALFDAFGFIADCLTLDVETACDLKQRGGFERLRTAGRKGAIEFEICYRDDPKDRPIVYLLAVSCDSAGRPVIEKELLSSPDGGRATFMDLNHGAGTVSRGYVPFVDDFSSSGLVEKVALTDPRQLGIATLGTLRDHPRIGRFRDFLKGWYLSYFSPDAARGLPPTGPQKHLNVHGGNIANYVQYLQRAHKDRLHSILNRIAEKIPGISRIDAVETEDKRVLLRFNDRGFQDPFLCATNVRWHIEGLRRSLALGRPRPATVHLHRGA